MKYKIIISIFLCLNISNLNAQMNNLDWEEFLVSIYDKIKVESGTLSHRISNETFYEGGNIECLSVTFKLEEFTYNDPFYGEITGDEIWFDTYRGDKILNFDNLTELENKEFVLELEEQIGVLSNSIDFTIHRLKFGTIKDNTIPITMEFSFINSNSGYGSLSGSSKEHSIYKKEISATLTIEDLIYEEYKAQKESGVDGLKYIDPRYYDIENKVEGEFGVSYPDGRIVQYKIPVKYR